MAREVREFAVSVPAGTLQAAPALTTLTMPARIVRRIRVRVPPGPNGLMGFALASSGVPIIPWGSGQWFVANDETFTWELEGQITSGAWQLRAYNTGAYAHTVYLTFELDPPQVARAPIVTPVAVFDSGTIAPEPLPEPPPEPVPEPLPEPVPPPPPVSVDGYAIAKVNALAATQAALGLVVSVSPLPVPDAGTLARTAYDAAKAAIVANLGAIFQG